MGPLLVLICPYFRENAIVTCKIVSFPCSLDNFLLKNLIISFFGNQISKWRSLKKQWLFLTYFSHFLVTREKTRKFLSAHMSLTYIHIFCSPYSHFFYLTNFAKITNLSCMVSF